MEEKKKFFEEVIIKKRLDRNKVVDKVLTTPKKGYQRLRTQQTIKDDLLINVNLSENDLESI